MNVEQHAEAILNAACTWAEPEHYTEAEWQAILTAVEAAMVAGAEAMREATVQKVRSEWWDSGDTDCGGVIPEILSLDSAAIIKKG